MIMELSDKDFATIKRFIHRSCGIELSDQKKYLRLLICVIVVTDALIIEFAISVIENLPIEMRDRFTDMREMDLQVQSMLWLFHYSSIY